jgi:S-adenosylmethionine:tRNA ribosyltransferase-isomerase
MRATALDYELPPELIAQRAAEPRDSARLLVYDRSSGRIRHRRFRELPLELDPSDLLVVNDTRVLPVRLRARRASGGAAELLLLEPRGEGGWEALVRPYRRLREGETLEAGELRATIIERLGEGRVHVVMEAEGPFEQALERAGEMPLPPYITEPLDDAARYQTVYAREPGSAAAPTAGLHFTRALLDRLGARGIGFATLVLHVGLDTFRPITEADPSTHRMHREWYTVPTDVRARIEAARAAGGRVIAVGTTSVRALETWASTRAVEGWTELFIRPGYQFRVVDGLLTNFHLPASTLLMLVSAFAGRERVLAAYAAAVQQAYRFYSFGDAMLVLDD